MSFDPQLDAQLRDVPLPRGLVARLKSSLVPTDEQLDVRLREVELPAAILSQLREIPGHEPMDGRLREVAVPFEIVWRARRDSWRTKLRRVVLRFADLATALLLFLGTTVALTALAGAIVASVYPQALPRDEPAFVVASNPPVELESTATAPSIQFVSIPPPAAAATGPALAGADERTVFDVEPPEVPQQRDGGPVTQWFTSLARGAKPMDNVVLARWGILGYPQFGEELTPALESPRLPRAVGIELPIVRGYDRAFAIRSGVFPPISPAAHPALAEVSLPLVSRTDSWDLVRNQVQQGRWPAPSLVRTEEFLAAVNYRFPPASPGELAIRAAAGPSVFGPAGTGLLQIAAVAGELPRHEGQANHLVLAIDISASMLRGGRMELVRQAVDRLLDHLGPHDRLSLVVFHEEVLYEVERAAAAEGDAMRRLLAELHPARGTDLAEGLQRAVALAWGQNAEPSNAARIVLITDSHVAMSPAAQAKVTEMIQASAARGTQLLVLDVGDQPEEDEVLASWAEMMHGDVRRPRSVEQAAWLLVETLYGQSALLAREARLTVRFNTQAVAAYRLIGHEANAMAAIRPASLAAELRAGEVATALLEIWFQPNDENEVGQVRLTWRDPSSGHEQQRTQRISRIQFAPTWEQSPLSLQQAAIAAQTAELLRGSRVFLRELGQAPQGKGDLAELRETANRAHPRLAERPDFRHWIDFLDQLSNVRTP